MTVYSRKATLVLGALMAYLAPKLANDAKVSLDPILAGVSGKNFAEKKAGIAAGVKTATAGKLAKDASIEDVAQLLDALQGQEVAEGVDADPSTGLPMAELPKPAAEANDGPDAGAVLALLRSKGVPEDVCAEVEKMLAGTAADEEDDGKKKDDGDKFDKKAMDAAIESARKEATAAAAKNQREIREAERAVRPYVGELTAAFDSAEDVYGAALRSLGVKVDGVHASAFPALLAAQPKAGSRQTKEPAVALDAAGAESFAKRFPEAARLN